MIFKEKLYVLGRGDILTLSCRENGIDTRSLSVEDAMRRLPSVGAEIIYYGSSYIVCGIEAHRNLLSPPHLGDHVGLVVRKK